MTNKEILENNVLIANFMKGLPYTKNRGSSKGGTMWAVEYDDIFTREDIFTRVNKPAMVINGLSYLGYIIRDSELKFNTSWNWLMPVVEKIENIQLDTDNSFNVTIGSGLYCVIQDAYGELIEIHRCRPTKIESVYGGVIQFIKWYNKQQ